MEYIETVSINGLITQQENLSRYYFNEPETGVQRIDIQEHTEHQTLNCDEADHKLSADHHYVRCDLYYSWNNLDFGSH